MESTSEELEKTKKGGIDHKLSEQDQPLCTNHKELILINGGSSRHLGEQALSFVTEDSSNTREARVHLSGNQNIFVIGFNKVD
ncbi:MAG: hypothetical protein AB8B95_01965 [Pseudohongiellaceae bacterium]